MRRDRVQQIPLEGRGKAMCTHQISSYEPEIRPPLWVGPNDAGIKRGDRAITGDEQARPDTVDEEAPVLDEGLPEEDIPERNTENPSDTPDTL
jgi:hypothetical protein